MNDFTKYEQMRDSGLSPEEIYVAAKLDEGNNLKSLWFVRQLFGESLTEAKTIVARGETLFFNTHILPIYERLRDQGLSAAQIYQATCDNGVLSEIMRLRILRLLFNLGLAEAMRIAGAVQSNNAKRTLIRLHSIEQSLTTNSVITASQ